MIVEELNLVFVHVPKTAGMSVEAALCKKIGVVWEERRDLERLALHRNPEPEPALPRKLGHLSAAQYVDLGFLTAEQWADAFAFSIVRNPWARVASAYQYLGISQRTSFRDWILSGLPGGGYHVSPQVHYLCDEGGHVLVDRVLRFESLSEDWLSVADRFDLDRELPHVNSRRTWTRSPVDVLRLARRRGLRSAFTYHQNLRPTWRDYFDEDTVAHVADMYRADVERFGYSFAAAP